MKKIFTTLLAVAASAFFCNASFAKPMLMQQVPAASAATACAPYGDYKTCVSVSNSSGYTALVYINEFYMYVSIPSGVAQPIVDRDINYVGLNLTFDGYTYFVENRGKLLILPNKKVKQ